jgi:hypothetical protein
MDDSFFHFSLFSFFLCLFVCCCCCFYWKTKSSISNQSEENGNGSQNEEGQCGWTNMIYCTLLIIRYKNTVRLFEPNTSTSQTPSLISGFQINQRWNFKINRTKKITQKITQENRPLAIVLFPSKQSSELKQ